MLNVVTHAGYKEKDRRKALLSDDGVGQAYIDANFDVKSALFLMELEHFEGESRIGLGVRTFNEVKVHESSGEFEMAWYVLKSKSGIWSKAPKFVWSISGYCGLVSLGPMLSSGETRDHILPIEVEQTDGSTTDEPRLTERLVQVLRERFPHLWRVYQKPIKQKRQRQEDDDDDDEEEEEEQEEEQEESTSSCDERASSASSSSPEVKQKPRRAQYPVPAMAAERVFRKRPVK